MTKSPSETAGVLGDDLGAGHWCQSQPCKMYCSLGSGGGLVCYSFILVPAALLISAVYPPLVLSVACRGGLFLVYEGVKRLFIGFGDMLYHMMKSSRHAVRPMRMKK